MYLGDKGLDSLYKRLGGAKAKRGGSSVAASGGAESKVDDVKVNGTSVVTEKVANIDLSGYGYAKDSDVVHNTGDEFVRGQKTFTGSALFRSGVSFGSSDKGHLNTGGDFARWCFGSGNYTEEAAVEMINAGQNTAFNFGYGFSKEMGVLTGIFASINGASNTDRAIAKDSKTIPTGGQVWAAVNQVEVVAVSGQYSLTAGKNYLLTADAQIYVTIPDPATAGEWVKVKLATSAKWTFLYNLYSTAISGEGPAIVEAYSDGQNWYITKQAFNKLQ